MPKERSRSMEATSIGIREKIEERVILN